MINNDQYVFVFGGHFKLKHFYHNIYVYNFKWNEFKKSKIKCPTKGDYITFVHHDDLKDNLLTFGYIRYYFNVQIFPKHLITFIVKWVSQNQQIHLICDQGKHWEINANHIINNIE